MTITLTQIDRTDGGDTIYGGFGTCNTNFTAIQAAINAALSHTLTAKTADYSVAAADLTGMKTFTNDGAAGEINFTLPAGAANYKADFYVTDAQYLKVTAAGTNKFRYLSSQGAAGGYIRANTVGTHWSVTWSGDDWVVDIKTGVLNYDE